MSDPLFFQEGFEKQLAHVVEECGELLAAAGKTQRWGPWSTDPYVAPATSAETNIVWLRREMDDVEQAIQRLRRTMADSVEMGKVK